MPAMTGRGRKRARSEEKPTTTFKQDEHFAKTKAGKGCEKKWYKKTEKYWSKVGKTIGAVTGGGVHRRDVNFSRAFVSSLRRSAAGKRCAFGTALDVGSGIGRVTKAVLLDAVDKRVDLLEPARQLLSKARDDLGGKPRVGAFRCSSLLKFRPGRAAYDLVWCQWILMYITDHDMKTFLNRLKPSLRPGGIVIVKENVPDDGDQQSYVERDDKDGCGPNELVRTPKHLEELFARSGYKVLKKQKQRDARDDSFRLMMYALTV